MNRLQLQPGSTLALVESPVQFLHVLEWCHATGSAHRLRIAVLAPRDQVSREQLRTMLDFAVEEEIDASWHDARRHRLSLLQTVAEFAPALAAAHRLVVGDPFSGLIQAMLPFARAADVVVVDDGTATMEFAAQLAEGRPLARWDAHASAAARAARSPFGRRARQFFTPDAHHSVTLFTAMPVAPIPGMAVRPNGYDWTRRRFGEPEVVRRIDIVGTSLVESGVVDTEAYLHAVEVMTAPGLRGRYYAHRRESDEKLALLAERTGLTVIRPRVPLEIECRRGTVAEQLISFPSSVGYTLPLVLRSVSSTLTVVDVDPSWIRQEVSDGARGFLATIASQARQRKGVLAA